MSNLNNKYKNAGDNIMTNSESQYARISAKILAGDIDELKKYLWYGARNRARRKNIPFSITVEDIIIPQHCPVLGMTLVSNISKGRTYDNSPTIDRIIPNIGYIPSNIRVISHKANSIKGSSTLDELRAVLQYMKGKCDVT